MSTGVGTPPPLLPPGAGLWLLRGSLGRGAVAELALSHALLDQVAAVGGPRASAGPPPAAAGGLLAAARLYRPEATLAFGRMDAFQPAFATAVDLARALGFDPVLRSPGGKAAAYHPASVVLELAVADDDPRARIPDRFAALAGLVVGALRGLGVPAEAGELPGEYCPGRFSVVAGGVKLGGIAQRVIAGASLTSIALVVEDGARVRSVLEGVSAALGYLFDPATAGAVQDVAPGVTTADVEQALEQALAAVARIEPMTADEELLAAAANREPEHRPHGRAIATTTPEGRET